MLQESNLIDVFVDILAECPFCKNIIKETLSDLPYELDIYCKDCCEFFTIYP